MDLTCSETMPKMSCHDAAYFGDYDALVAAHKGRYPWNDFVAECAAMRGNASCLRYAITNGCHVSDTLPALAFVCDDVECLKVLLAHNCPWNWTYLNVAKSNHSTACLAYARTLMTISPSPKERAARAAVANMSARAVLLPRLRAAVRARAIVFFWMRVTTERVCAPGGVGRKRDRDEFTRDMACFA